MPTSPIRSGTNTIRWNFGSKGFSLNPYPWEDSYPYTFAKFLKKTKNGWSLKDEDESESETGWPVAGNVLSNDGRYSYGSFSGLLLPSSTTRADVFGGIYAGQGWRDIQYFKNKKLAGFSPTGNSFNYILAMEIHQSSNTLICIERRFNGGVVYKLVGNEWIEIASGAVVGHLAWSTNAVSFSEDGSEARGIVLIEDENGLDIPHIFTVSISGSSPSSVSASISYDSSLWTSNINYNFPEGFGNSVIPQIGLLIDPNNIYGARENVGYYRLYVIAPTGADPVVGTRLGTRTIIQEYDGFEFIWNGWTVSYNNDEYDYPYQVFEEVRTISTSNPAVGDVEVTLTYEFETNYHYISNLTRADPSDPYDFDISETNYDFIRITATGPFGSVILYEQILNFSRTRVGNSATHGSGSTGIYEGNITLNFSYKWGVIEYTSIGDYIDTQVVTTEYTGSLNRDINQNSVETISGSYPVFINVTIDPIGSLGINRVFSEGTYNHYYNVTHFDNEQTVTFNNGTIVIPLSNEVRSWYSGGPVGFGIAESQHFTPYPPIHYGAMGTKDVPQFWDGKGEEPDGLVYYYGSSIISDKQLAATQEISYERTVSAAGGTNSYSEDLSGVLITGYENNAPRDMTYSLTKQLNSDNSAAFTMTWTIYVEDQYDEGEYIGIKLFVELVDEQFSSGGVTNNQLIINDFKGNSLINESFQEVRGYIGTKRDKKYRVFSPPEMIYNTLTSDIPSGAENEANPKFSFLFADSRENYIIYTVADEVGEDVLETLKIYYDGNQIHSQILPLSVTLNHLENLSWGGLQINQIEGEFEFKRLAIGFRSRTAGTIVSGYFKTENDIGYWVCMSVSFMEEPLTAGNLTNFLIQYEASASEDVNLLISPSGTTIDLQSFFPGSDPTYRSFFPLGIV